MQSSAQTIKGYLTSLNAEDRKVLTKVRQVILASLPEGYEEIMQYGMISYVVPLKLYPKGYLNKKDTPLPYIGLAAQKNYFALYLMNIYGDKAADQWFRKEYLSSGKRLNMGKSCVRFKALDDLPLPLIAKAVKLTTVKKYIRTYEQAKNK